MKEPTYFGYLLRKYRAKNGDTLESLANKMKLSISYLSALELGNKTIPQDIPDRINSVLHLDDEELLELKIARDMVNGFISIDAKDRDNLEKHYIVKRFYSIIETIEKGE